MKQYINSMICIAAVFACFSRAEADKAFSENRKGIQSFSEKKYEESETHFTDALIERPDSPEITYNLGTALSESKKTEEALKHLQSSAARLKDPKQRAAAFFNTGNTRLINGDFQGAVNDYRQAVKLDQHSKDIRHNLELAMRKLQEQQQQQQKKEGDQDKQDQNKDKDDKKDEKNKTNNSDQKQQQEKEQQQSNQQQSEERQMTPEEAKRILDALSDEEKKALSLKRMQTQQEMRQGDDW